MNFTAQKIGYHIKSCQSELQQGFSGTKEGFKKLHPFPPSCHVLPKIKVDLKEQAKPNRTTPSGSYS